MIKYLSAAVIAASFALAGCNTMSGMGEDLKRGGEKLGIGSKEKAEQMTPSTEPATTTTDPGAVVNPNTGMPADATHGTTTDAHTGHDAASQSSGSESMMDKARNKAREWMK